MAGRFLGALLLFLAVIDMRGNAAVKYMEDVLAGRQVVCKWTRLAVERHVRDLERAERKDPDFPYRFEPAQAQRIIEFTEQLRHTKGEWANPRLHDTRIRLEPWQKFIDWVLFGWRRIEGGHRRFTRAYISTAKKNGKTTLAAATGNYCFLADSPKEMGAEVYCIATKKDQAKVAWEEAQRQIEGHGLLRKVTRLYRQSSTIVLRTGPGRMKPLGKDSGTEDGLNPHFILVDEYHAHPDASLLNVLESGTGSRVQPLTYIITTSGFDLECACYQEEHQLAIGVLEGSIRPAPENFFCVIYTLDPDDDWTDSKIWVKSNPNLGVSVQWKFLEDRIRGALQTPRKQNDVKVKNLNIWTQARERWIPEEAWKACAQPVEPEALAGRRAFVGIDLSTSIDITAVAYCFPPAMEGGRFQFLYRFFMPKENLLERQRRDRVPYLQWVEMGLIVTTEGNVIDFDVIERQVLEDARKYRFEEIAFDPWKAQEIVNHLTDAGFIMVAMSQRFAVMAPASQTFEQKVLAADIAHGNNPVMNWMIGCTEVKSDRQGNFMPIKPPREKTAKRIDGVVASIMALDRAVKGITMAEYQNEPTPRPSQMGIRGAEF